MGDVVALVLDAPAMIGPAAEHRYSEKTAEELLRGRWGARYEERIDFATVAFEQLPKRSQRYLEERGLNTWPDFVDKLGHAR